MRESLATHRGLRNAAPDVQRVLMWAWRPAMDTAQAQRVTADFHSRSGPLTGGPRLAPRLAGRHRRRGGAGAARPAPLEHEKGPPDGGPSSQAGVFLCLADLGLAELDAHVELLTRD